MNVRQLKKALKNLGDSPDTVRDTLLREHCLGVKGSWHKCPVVNYLRDQFPEVPKIAVGGRAVVWGSEYLDAYENIPDPIVKFVERFDNGAYPELELNGS